MYGESTVVHDVDIITSAGVNQSAFRCGCVERMAVLAKGLGIVIFGGGGIRRIGIMFGRRLPLSNGRLRKLVRHARKSVYGVYVLAGFWSAAFRAGRINFGVQWTSVTIGL